MTIDQAESYLKTATAGTAAVLRRVYSPREGDYALTQPGRLVVVESFAMTVVGPYLYWVKEVSTDAKWLIQEDFPFQASWTLATKGATA